MLIFSALLIIYLETTLSFRGDVRTNFGHYSCVGHTSTWRYIGRSSAIDRPKLALNQYTAVDDTNKKKKWSPTRANPSNKRGSSGAGIRNQDNRQHTGSKLLLDDPQLLVRFRIPRDITEFKLSLVQLQSQYDQERVLNSPSNSHYGGFTPVKDPFLDSLASSTPVVVHDPGHSTYSVDGGRKTSAKSRSVLKAGDRKGSEGSKPKLQVSRRGSRAMRSDYDSSAELEGAYDSEYDDSNFYGDEGNIGLSSIPAGTLASLDAQGFSLEDMQVSLYGEYGVKVSMQVLKRRLQDDRFGRGSRKGQSGKTRRERTKARNARRDPPAADHVYLPESGSLSVKYLAELMDIGAGDIIKYLMLNEGTMITITQNIDILMAKKVVAAFGKTLATEADIETEISAEAQGNSAIGATSSSGVRRPRPPVVTIMGHVDHGKTTLLDKIRNSRVALSEAGGITQGISAFSVEVNAAPSTGSSTEHGEQLRRRRVTFFDTPGHSAFSEMRGRGTNITDIVVLVVAADDGVMDQTKECIVAAQTAGCPLVVAINKIDKDGSDVGKVKTDLTNYGIILEELGGDVQCVEISAKKGAGIDELLEKVLLQADVMDLTAPEGVEGSGTVIEARVDKGLGVVVSALVQRGTVRVGDIVLAGASWGRVRRLLSDDGSPLKLAGPSTPVQIIGMSSLPVAGEELAVVDSEAAAKEVADARSRLQKVAQGSLARDLILAQATGVAAGEFDSREVLKIPLVVKADALGSVEALIGAINGLQVSDDTAVCRPDIVYSGIGDVTSSDVAIAAAAKARIIAFNVASALSAMDDARAVNAQISYYNVVYELLDELQTIVTATLAPPPPGQLLGRAVVKKVFKIGKAGNVAGSVVTEGIMRFDSRVRILRGKRNEIYSGLIASLKVLKDDMKEVQEGSECGISFKAFTDIADGDIIECFSP